MRIVAKRWLGVAGFVLLLATIGRGAAISVSLPDAKDTLIDSYFAYSGYDFSAWATTVAGGSTGEVKRALLSFDLSSVPASAVISSARLRLAFTGNNGGTATTLSLYRMTTAWTNQACWIGPNGGSSAWSAPGAGSDHASMLSSSLFSAFQGSNSSRVDFTFDNLTQDVQQWVSDSSSNRGWILTNSVEANAASSKQLATRESLASLGYDGTPMLDIVYSTAPAGFRLTGRAALGDFAGSASGVSMQVQLRRQDNDTTTTATVGLASDGSFIIPNVAPGTYDVWIKPSHWLARLVVGVIVGTADVPLGTINFANGDADGNNAVTSADLSAVLTALDAMSGSSTDLDGDGAVTSTDLSILLANLDRTGEQYPPPSLPLLVETGFVNVCDNTTFGNYGPGAKGDGVTDDTVAISSAFAYARDNPGSEIYFPLGKYLISDTLYLGGVGFTVRMEGQFADNWTRQSPDSGIFWDNVSGPRDRPMMKIYNSVDYSVDGLCLDGGDRAQDGLVTDNISGGLLTAQSFTNCHFRSCTRYGVCISPWQPGYPGGGIENDLIWFSNCKFTNCGSSNPVDGAGLTIQSAQSLCDTFDNCTFVSRKNAGGKHHVWIRAGRSIELRDCTWLTYQNRDIGADIILDPFSTCGAAVYGGTSTAVGVSYRCFFYCNFPLPGILAPVTIKDVHAEAPVYLNVFGHQNAASSTQTGVVVSDNPYLGNLTVIDTYFNEHTARGVCHDNAIHGGLQVDPTVVHWNP